MKKTYKVGIVGFGGQGYSHTKTIAEIENIEVGGIFDIADARIDFAKEKGFHAYKSYDEMLSDPEIDIITVATPNDSHHRLTVAALRAGKHVVCEKPAAMNSDELADMIRVAGECGRIFTVHQNRRYDADFRVMKKIYDEGELGPVHRFERRVQGCNGIPKDWRSQPEFGGGMMLDWGVHLLDQTLQLIPEKIKKVYCRLEHVTNELCDDGAQILRLSSDVAIPRADMSSGGVSSIYNAVLTARNIIKNITSALTYLLCSQLARVVFVLMSFLCGEQTVRAAYVLIGGLIIDIALIFESSLYSLREIPKKFKVPSFKNPLLLCKDEILTTLISAFVGSLFAIVIYFITKTDVSSVKNLFFRHIQKWV